MISEEEVILRYLVTTVGVSAHQPETVYCKCSVHAFMYNDLRNREEAMLRLRTAQDVYGE